MMNVPYSLPPYHWPALTFHGTTEKCWPIICTSFPSEKGKIIPQVELNCRREILMPNGRSNKEPGRNVSPGPWNKQQKLFILMGGMVPGTVGIYPILL